MSTIETRAYKHGGYNGAGSCAVCGCPVIDSILACVQCVNETNDRELEWARWLINDARSERYRDGEFDKNETVISDFDTDAQRYVDNLLYSD